MASYALSNVSDFSPSLSVSTATPKQTYDNDLAADLVSQYESGNKNIPNYRYDIGHTASGFYQITDTNWNKYGPSVGVDTNQFPTAISAPKNLQRSVFDAMYDEQGFAPWANYNPRLADAIGEGKLPTPGWVASPQAFDTENRKSNTSIRYMSPEQYLSLLPPIENDEASKAKKENLNTSLSNGDNIEALPSLEVEPKGDNLKIVDNDGRHRAQAAIDAGVDQIPVAINGAPENKDFKKLIGTNKKSLPYNEFKPVPPASAPEQAQKIAPLAFQQGGPQQEQSRANVQPQNNSGPQQSVFDPALATATQQSPVPTKPDYYPQIVAGINSDVYNPRGIGYRGAGVPDLATNATASGRIGAANKNSAGQVGLTPSSPINALLSSLNPISSAQAAEVPSGPVSLQNVTDFAPPSSGYTDFTPPGAPKFGVPPRPNALMSAPIVNAVMSPITNLGADAYALARGQPRWAGNVLPTMAAFQEARSNALNQITLPETPTGQEISRIINSPARLVGWAFEKILGEDLAGKVAPYAQIGTDVLGPLLAAFPGLRSMAGSPARNVLNRLVKTPDMRAIEAINKAQPHELQAGGMSVADMSNRLAEAQSKGIPMTPADMLVPGGPQARLLGYALEHSPEAVADTRKFLSERTEGERPSPGAEPVGGTLARMTKQVEDHFGAGSAIDRQQEIAKSIKDNKGKLNKAEQRLSVTQKKIKDYIISTDKDVSQTARMKELRTREAKQKAASVNIQKQIKNDTTNSSAMQFGGNIFKDSMREEDIDNFYKHVRGAGVPGELDHFKLGISDAIRHEYRKVRQLGQEPNKTVLPENIRNKISHAFGNDRAAADDFLNTVDYEDQVSEGTKNILKEVNSAGYLSDVNKRKLSLVMESLGHFALGHTGFITRSGAHAAYWALRGARQLSDYLRGAGGSAPRKAGQEIANALLNPHARLSQSGIGMFNAPVRPASSVANINALSNAAAMGGVTSATSANQQPNAAP